MVRRWKQANRILDEMAAERRNAGLPEPKFHEHPLIVFIIGAGLSVLVVALATWLLTTIGALRVGIVLIVGLGATGLVLRGLGELNPAPRGPRFKAFGYFVGAMTYVATATVALFNAVPALFEGR